MAKKLYDYDDVMNYLQSGQLMDNSIQELALNIKLLTEKVQKCENIFHGMGNKSIAKSYQAIYNAIGCSSMTNNDDLGEQGCGMWKNLATAVKLCNLCYQNAEKQKVIDIDE